MTLQDLSSALGNIVDLLLEWSESLRHPLLTCERLLGQAEPERARMKRAGTIWTTSFLLGAAVLTPLYNSIGIKFENLGFQVSVFLFQTINFLLSAIVIHIGLRRYRVNSKFEDTFLLYSVVFAPYYPVVSLMYYPITAALLSSLKAAKMQAAGLTSTIAMVWKAIGTPSSATMSALSQIGSLMAILISTVLVGIFAEAAAKHYLTERQRILTSISFSSVVLLIVPTALCSLLYYFVVFSFS